MERSGREVWARWWLTDAQLESIKRADTAQQADIRMQNVILGASDVSFEFALTNAPIETLQLLAFF